MLTRPLHSNIPFGPKNELRTSRTSLKTKLFANFIDKKWAQFFFKIFKTKLRTCLSIWFWPKTEIRTQSWTSGKTKQFACKHRTVRFTTNTNACQNEQFFYWLKIITSLKATFYFQEVRIQIELFIFWIFLSFMVLIFKSNQLLKRQHNSSIAMKSTVARLRKNCPICAQNGGYWRHLTEKSIRDYVGSEGGVGAPSVSSDATMYKKYICEENVSSLFTLSNNNQIAFS